PVERDAAPRGPQRPGDAVEERGLPCPVRPDEHAPLAGADLQRHAVDGREAAEHLGEVLRFDRFFAHPASLPEKRPCSRLARPTSPSGAHSTVAMKTAPMMAWCISKKLETQLRKPRTTPAPMKGPMIVPVPPTIAIRAASTEIWNEDATGFTKRL